MKIVVHSSELYSSLVQIKNTINPKNTLPILDNFLFSVSGNTLEITSSDLETTSKVSIELENFDGDGAICIEAKRIIDLLRELPPQPVIFDIDLESLNVEILTDNGKYSVVGQEAENFPFAPEIKKANDIELSAQSIYTGISKTIFATADDELRPVMNGILFNFTEDALIFVATDAHKLVKVSRKDVLTSEATSFILPKKPANILKNLLKTSEEQIRIKFDDKNAEFSFDKFIITCRLTEGTYPNYESVFPQNNEIKMIIQKDSIINTLKRVTTFSNHQSNLIRLSIKENILTVSAQDIDFAISAHERVNCQFEGEPIEIGFKSQYLSELLSNLDSKEVVLEFSEPSRAALISAYDRTDYDTDISQLIMPMMINS